VSHFLTQEELATIGSVVVESANLEYAVEIFICRLLNLTPRHRTTFLARGMFDGKLQTLENVAQMQLADKEECLAQLKTLISEMKANNSERTLVVHGIWINIDASGSSGLLSLKWLDEPMAEKVVKPIGDPRTLTMTKARALVEKLKVSQNSLMAMYAKIWPTR